MEAAVSTFLLIEDDLFLVEWVQRLAEQSAAGVEILAMRCEREFWLKRRELAKLNLRGVIIDVMLPWEDGDDFDSEEFLEPKGQSFDAGIRILVALSEDPDLANIPVLIQTVNDRSAVDLPPGIRFTFLRKDEADQKLLGWINENK